MERKFEDRIQIRSRRADFKILQVTDIHLTNFGLIDRFCLRSVLKMAKIFDVDLVACTGDLFGLRTVPAMKRASHLFDQIVGSAFPWVFAFGNHDQELKSFDEHPATQLDAVEQYIEHLPGCLYKQTRQFMENYHGTPINDDPWEREAITPKPGDAVPLKSWDGFYGDNYLVEVMDAAGENVAWNVFVLNSRRGFHVPPKVLNWVGDKIACDKKVPSICFYHVPNYEYHLIWEKGIAKGIKRESVCYERDRGRVHSALKEFGSIKACFVGHDHVNDYFGELDGITYVYGRKTCLGGYGSYKKVPAQFVNTGKAIRIGAKLITLSLDKDGPARNKFSQVSVFADGSTWSP
nr:metallophosphoesterase [Candidatus Sigynarchaeota archaeon]